MLRRHGAPSTPNPPLRSSFFFLCTRDGGGNILSWSSTFSGIDLAWLVGRSLLGTTNGIYVAHLGRRGSRPNLQPSPSRPTIYTSQLGSGSSLPLSSLQRWRWASTRIWGGGGGEGRLGRAADCRFYFVGYTRIPTTITAPKTTPPPPCLLSCFYPYSRIFSTSSGFLALLLVAVAACARLCVCVSEVFC